MTQAMLRSHLYSHMSSPPLYAVAAPLWGFWVGRLHFTTRFDQSPTRHG